MQNRSSYSIAEFVDGLQIVPTIWLRENESKCLWPNFNDPARINRSVIQGLAADDKSWTLFSVRVFGSASTYEAAVVKLKLAQQLSDIDTASDGEGGKKNRHSKAKRAITPSDEGESDGEQDARAKKLPPPPKRLRNVNTKSTAVLDTSNSGSAGDGGKKIRHSRAKRAISPSDEEESDIEQDARTIKPPPPPKRSRNMNTKSTAVLDAGHSRSTEFVEGSINIHVSSKASHIDKKTAKQNQMKAAHDVQSDPQVEYSMAAREESLETRDSHQSDSKAPPVDPYADNEFKKNVLRKLNAIVFKLRIIDEKLDNLHEMEKCSRTNHAETANSPSEEATMNIPVDSEEDFEILEKFLASPINFKQEVNLLQKIGGTNAHSNTLNVLKRLLVDEVAQLFSWVGRKDKRAFKNTKVCRLLFSTVLANYSSTTETDIEKTVSKWLAQSTVRLKRTQ